VSASDLSDESLLRYYNSIRKQVEADRDRKHKFMGGDTIKEYAESLRLELYKRRLPYTAIDWSGDQQANTPPALRERLPHAVPRWCRRRRCGLSSECPMPCYRLPHARTAQARSCK
jgi:hypothetical protein